jgi:fatty-acyl-CoA synthase
MRPCATGESGLVQVRGPQVFPGYLDPAHTKGALDSEGWLTTGDLGYLNTEERLFLTGREKDLIVRSGHNIDPTAIEEVADRFIGVAASAAVAMPDAYAGEVPALFVVAREGVQLCLPALERFLSQHIHERPAFPKFIKLIDEIPVTAVGKVFKPRLREMAIVEKVQAEAKKACGTDVRASASFVPSSSGRVLVHVTVSGATPDELVELRDALALLAQDYEVNGVI